MSEKFIDKMLLPVFNMDSQEIIGKLKEFDLNGDGFVKKEYIKLWLQKELRKQLLEIIGGEIVELMKKSDEDGNDGINYVKFVRDDIYNDDLEIPYYKSDGFVRREHLIHSLFKVGREKIEPKLDAEIDRWIGKTDKNENGQIDYVSFTEETFFDSERIDSSDYFLREVFSEEDEQSEDADHIFIWRVLRVLAGVSLNFKEELFVFKEEFSKSLFEMSHEEMIAKLMQLKKFDFNGDGFVKKEYVELWFQKELRKELIEKIGSEIVELMKKADENGEDEINYAKFIRDETYNDHWGKWFYPNDNEDLETYYFNNDDFMRREHLIKCMFEESQQEIEPTIDWEVEQWVTATADMLKTSNETGRQIDYVEFIEKMFLDYHYPYDDPLWRISLLFDGASFKKCLIREIELVAMFKKYDLNGDGFIDKEELKKLMIKLEEKNVSNVTDKLNLDLESMYDDFFYGRVDGISLDEFKNKCWNLVRLL